jgi:hypothetical protein
LKFSNEGLMQESGLKLGLLAGTMKAAGSYLLLSITGDLRCCFRVASKKVMQRFFRRNATCKKHY